MITVLLVIIGGCIIVWQFQILSTSQYKNQKLLVIQEKNYELMDLYKALGQSIVALNIQLQAAQKLSQINPIQSQQSVFQAYQLSSQMMQELRQTLRKMDTECRQINSDMLYNHHLMITIQNLKSKT